MIFYFYFFIWQTACIERVINDLFLYLTHSKHCVRYVADSQTFRKMTNDLDHFAKTLTGYLVIIYRFLEIEKRCLVVSTKEPFVHAHCITFADLFTVLCINCTICSCRWTHLLFRSRSPSWFIEWIIEQLISIALTLYVFNHIWRRFIETSIYWSITLVKNLVGWNYCLRSKSITQVAQWIQLNSTIVVPILGSVWIFYAMLRLTGQWKYCKEFVCIVGETLAITVNNILDCVWPFGKGCNSNVNVDVESDGSPKLRRLSRDRSRSRRV